MANKSGPKTKRGGKLSSQSNSSTIITGNQPSIAAATVQPTVSQPVTPPPAPAPTPAAQPIPPVQPAPQPTQAARSIDFSTYTDDQFITAISGLKKVDMPNFLNKRTSGANDDFQAFIYKNAINVKPVQEDDATFKKNSAGKIQLWRTVNSNYNPKDDTGLTAKQIASQFINGDLSRTGDGVYGQGYYFANTRNRSISYGHTSGNIQKTAVINAYLNSNAKIGDSTTINRGLQREINSGSKLGKALAKLDYNSQQAVYAMRKGYNVIAANNGTGYYVILDRSAVTVNKQISAK